MPADLVTPEEVEAAWPKFADLPELRRASLISAACAILSNAVGWTLGYDTHDDVLRPEGTRILRLNAKPIVAITTIETGLAGSRVALDAADYAIMKSGRTGEVELYRGFPGGFVYPSDLYGGHPGYGDVRVEYTAGYVAEADDPVQDPVRPVCPPDLKEAVILTIKAMSANVKGAGLKSETFPEYSYTLESGSGGSVAGIPSGAAGIINRYRRKRPA